MASTRLTRSITGSNAKKATLSFWIKRGALGGSAYVLFTNRIDASNDTLVRFTSDLIDFKDYQSGSNVGRLETTQVFRDISAWYHIVISIDTTLGTADDRQKMYVNGEQITSFASRTNYPQDTVLNINKTGTMEIGANNSADYFDGLMSYFAFVDGTAYDASYFGETNTATGIWKIKTAPSVTYGTNGFFLKMDTSSPGTDTSGNSNTFTASGTPTLAQDNASNNFATWNPQINNGITGNWLNGNTTIAPNGDTPNLYAPVTIPVSKGKWYSEHMITGGNGHGSLGLAGASNIAGMFKINFEPGETSPSFAFKCINGSIKMNGSNTTYGSAPGTSDAILGMAVDIDNKKVWYSINGTYVTYGGGVGNPASGTYGFDWSSLSDDFGWLIICGDSEVSGYGNWKSNFGNGFFGTTAVASSNADAAGHGLFEYAVPTGYYTLNTKNLNTYG